MVGLSSSYNGLLSTAIREDRDMTRQRMTAKQALFIEEYLLDLNATQAAIRAGYAKSTANKQASLWVGKTREACPEKMRHVWDAIQVAKGERIERAQVDADYVLRRLIEIDEMDVADILDEFGVTLPVRQWPSVWRRYLTAMDVAELYEGGGDDRQVAGLLKKIKWPDKVKNLELIGKHVTVQAFKERVGYQDDTGKTFAQLMAEVAPEESSPSKPGKAE